MAMRGVQIPLPDSRPPRSLCRSPLLRLLDLLNWAVEVVVGRPLPVVRRHARGVASGHHRRSTLCRVYPQTQSQEMLRDLCNAFADAG